MDLQKLLVLSLLILKCILEANGLFDPASVALITTIGGVITYLYNNPDTKQETKKFVYKVYNKACQFIGKCEGCEDYWIPANLQGLEFEMKSKVFGQPLAVDIILSALKNHLRNENPRRSLVLSFQGSPGTGKNFVSQMILKNMFRKGDDAQYVHFFRGSTDFPLKGHVNKYKEELVNTIKAHVYDCHRSMFVFDEVEKMPNGILDVISSFVRTKKEGNYDYRKIIFILLSNVGYQALNRVAVHAWRGGISREDMNTKELTLLLQNESYNGEGGLKHTGLVKNHDVSYFVPFLPLERHHVVQCLEAHVAGVKRQIMSPELTELVLEEMNFYPEAEQAFSTSGCKRIAEVADYLIEKQTRKRRRKQ